MERGGEAVAPGALRDVGDEGFMEMEVSELQPVCFACVLDFIVLCVICVCEIAQKSLAIYFRQDHSHLPKYV